MFERNVICEWIEETQPGPRLHPADPLLRAQHHAWMEFGSAILADLWVLETAQDAATFDTRCMTVAPKVAPVEQALDPAGPWFAGAAFSLVDAVFAPVFRYFDVFDTIADLGIFTDAPRVRALRAARAERPSVKAAVGDDYLDLLFDFLVKHQAHLLTLPS